ncbi:kinase-like domain-containing protein [Rhizophagus irregularis DAOM 181602=DAOM 197198]|nr:kinase-like domain-containing protein [Rhizophagus irregularis DAOM 181602=DAOM 197198]
MQLEINRLNDTIIEWIPLNQFNNIKALHESNSAIFVNGPLCYNYDKMEWERKPNEKVTLICLDNLQYTTDEFLNEIKTYITEKRIRDCVIEASKLFSKNYGLNRFNNIVKVYGISQNPDSKDYIIVLQDWHCENCANWMNGPLQHDYYKWKRIPNIKVALKYLHNSQDITEEFLNEQIKPYDIVIDEDDFTCNPPKIYGISQNPNTKNYLLVLEYGNHCEKCGEIYTLIYLNWCKSDLTLLYSAIWINGPLKYMQNEWERIPNREVALKCLYNSQNITNKILNKETEFYSIEINSQNNITNEFLNKIKSYFVEYDNIIKIYGISQNPDTKKYIIVLENGKHCEICNEIYTDLSYKWSTRRQPFANCAHDNILALKICNGIRPEINEHEAPQCYIELMKKCWDTNPNNRPNATEIKEEINKQIEEAQNKKLRFSCIRSNQLTTHPKACYTSRLLNPFTKDLPKYDNINNNSVEVIDFTNYNPSDLRFI